MPQMLRNSPCEAERKVYYSFTFIRIRAKIEILHNMFSRSSYIKSFDASGKSFRLATILYEEKDLFYPVTFPRFIRYFPIEVAY